MRAGANAVLGEGRAEDWKHSYNENLWHLAVNMWPHQAPVTVPGIFKYYLKPRIWRGRNAEGEAMPGRRFLA